MFLYSSLILLWARKNFSFVIIAFNTPSLFSNRMMSSTFTSNQSLKVPRTMFPWYAFLSVSSPSQIHTVNNVGLSEQHGVTLSAVQKDSVNFLLFWQHILQQQSLHIFRCFLSVFCWYFLLTFLPQYYPFDSVESHFEV